MLKPKEISRREPVWVALSEFYLDTELEEADFKRISLILKESGYSIAELKRINYEEVAPTVSPNLMSTAGVWSGFDEKWLKYEILKKITKNKKKSILNIVYIKYINWITKRYWREIEKF